MGVPSSGLLSVKLSARIADGHWGSFFITGVYKILVKLGVECLAVLCSTYSAILVNVVRPNRHDLLE